VVAVIFFLPILAAVLAGFLGLLSGQFVLLVAALGFVIVAAWVSATRTQVSLSAEEFAQRFPEVHEPDSSSPDPVGPRTYGDDALTVGP
jgi:hypothetical protein